MALGVAIDALLAAGELDHVAVAEVRELRNEEVERRWRQPKGGALVVERRERGRHVRDGVLGHVDHALELTLERDEAALAEVLVSRECALGGSLTGREERDDYRAAGVEVLLGTLGDVLDAEGHEQAAEEAQVRAPVLRLVLAAREHVGNAVEADPPLAETLVELLLLRRELGDGGGELGAREAEAALDVRTLRRQLGRDDLKAGARRVLPLLLKVVKGRVRRVRPPEAEARERHAVCDGRHGGGRRVDDLRARQLLLQLDHRLAVLGLALLGLVALVERDDAREVAAAVGPLEDLVEARALVLGGARLARLDFEHVVGEEDDGTSPWDGVVRLELVGALLIERVQRDAALALERPAEGGEVAAQVVLELRRGGDEDVLAAGRVVVVVLEHDGDQLAALADASAVADEEAEALIGAVLSERDDVALRSRELRVGGDLGVEQVGVDVRSGELLRRGGDELRRVDGTGALRHVGRVQLLGLVDDAVADFLASGGGVGVSSRRRRRWRCGRRLGVDVEGGVCGRRRYGRGGGRKSGGASAERRAARVQRVVGCVAVRHDLRDKARAAKHTALARGMQSACFLWRTVGLGENRRNGRGPTLTANVWQLSGGL